MTRVNDYAIMSRNIELMKYLKRFEAGQHWVLSVLFEELTCS
jgi:hypothetical protein